MLLIDDGARDDPLAVEADTIPVGQPFDLVLREEVEGPQTGNQDSQKDGKADDPRESIDEAVQQGSGVSGRHGSL